MSWYRTYRGPKRIGGCTLELKSAGMVMAIVAVSVLMARVTMSTQLQGSSFLVPEICIVLLSFSSFCVHVHVHVHHACACMCVCVCVCVIG